MGVAYQPSKHGAFCVSDSQNFYLRRAFEYEVKARAADNLAERFALMDTVQAYRDLALYARVNKTGVSKETDAEVQTLAERMTAADPISDSSKWMQARAG